MNQKTAKIIKKYAALKGLSEKQLKSEWNGMSLGDKDKKKQQMLADLVKK